MGRQPTRKCLKPEKVEMTPPDCFGQQIGKCILKTRPKARRRRTSRATQANVGVRVTQKPPLIHQVGGKQGIPHQETGGVGIALLLAQGR